MKLTFDYRIYGRYRRRGRRLRELVAKRLKKALSRLRRAVRGHLKLKRNQRRLIFGFLVVFISLLLASLWLQHVGAVQSRKQYEQRLTERQAKLHELDTKLQSVQKQQTTTQDQLKAKTDSEASLKAEIDSLNSQLESKRTQSLLNKVASVVSPKVSAQGVTNCGDNMYKQYIYSHESGCNTASVNSIGCAGIGQACPGSKLPCSLSDFACQDAYFTNYAISTYGSWEQAYNAWLRKGWW